MTQRGNNSWYSISVTVSPEAAEAIEYAFSSLDALGTEINHLHKKNLDTITVIGYFNELPDEERVEDELQYALHIYQMTPDAITRLERSNVEQIDWLAEWKKHWKPTPAGRFLIAPPWSDVEQEAGTILIRIEPNMAFGTGTHETTQLCLRAMDRFYSPGDSFLDVGTGTGILAIAAAKLNLKSEISNFKFHAYDTDKASVALARENAKLNGVGNGLEFIEGPISAATPVFDFVCANLTLDVINPLLPLLLEKARKTLVLSGILVEQTEEIIDALHQFGNKELNIEQSGEWISVLVHTEARQI